MNIREYISSGILESYVSGNLSEQERREVEINLARYPELREELRSVEETQERLLMITGIEPSAQLKARVFSRIPNDSDHRVVRIGGAGTLRNWQLAAAACLAMAIVAIIFALNYRTRWKAAESELLALNVQNRQIAENYNRVNERLNKLEDDIDVLGDPRFSRILLSGTPNAPDAMASVYWNENTREVYLRIVNMKKLSRENQYQLWAIIDGKPVDAGVFDADAPGLLRMKDIGRGAAIFAVTIEPRGGRQVPSLETMQVSGQVKG